MLSRLSWIFLLVRSICPALSIAYEPGIDLVGWFFDETGTESCAEGNPYESVTAYLCVKSPSISACGGWEIKTIVSGNCLVTTWDIGGSGTNIGTPPEFIVGYDGTDLPQMGYWFCAPHQSCCWMTSLLSFSLSLLHQRQFQVRCVPCPMKTGVCLFNSHLFQVPTIYQVRGSIAIHGLVRRAREGKSIRFSLKQVLG